jgi:hypothetical protein
MAQWGRSQVNSSVRPTGSDRPPVQELTTREEFLQDVLRQWSPRAAWRCALCSAAGFAAAALSLVPGGILATASSALVGACVGALYIVLLTAALRIAYHPRAFAFWNALGFWVTAPPDGFVPTHSLPCSRVRWPAKPESGVLYLGGGRAAFAPYRGSLFARKTLTLGPGVVARLSAVPTAVHWLLPVPSHVLQLTDSSQSARFLVARPSEMAPTVTALLAEGLA